MTDVVIIGAGQAGAACAAALRNGGFEGRITMFGAEPALPYQRPPLSKAYLLGEMSLDRLFLRPDSFYVDQNIDVRTGAMVESIDCEAHEIRVGGKVYRYDELVLTTGSAPRRLPAAIGGDLGGVYCMRDLADADALAPLFQEGARVLIVGGGYIGLEAAAVAAKKGLQVTLVEMADRILQRVAAPQTSDYFRALHISHGVDIREGTGLERLEGDTHVKQAILGDGTTLDLDFVIVGVGILPDIKLAEAAGIALDNGISVDTQGRTSKPHVWAAGDCASFPFHGNRIRLESVPNAIDQAECVARNIMGAGEDYVAKPWFWSDQYDIKLQIAGLNMGYDDVIARQDGATASFWYFAGDTLLAVDAMNDPRAYMIGKRLIEAGKTASKDHLSDPSFELKQLMRA